MAVLTISRQEGSLGDEIAKAVSDTLSYSLIDKHKIHDMSSGFKGDYSSEMDVITNESKPGFFDFIFHQRSVYGHMLASMVYDAAGKDKCVIVGRGGQFLLHGKTHVINARIVAPFDLRVERVMTRMNLEKKIASDYVRTSDQKREEFINYLYREKVGDLSWYDLVIDSDRFPMDRVVAFLVDELRRLEKQYPLTPEDIHTYQIQSLEKRIEIVLMKEMKDSNYVKVSANYDGLVVLSGYLSTEAENKAVLKHVRNVDGVTAVENKIIVSQFPVRPWY
ncbi:MAG: cytidylate kinase family protein [Proteobacteria bacterium]|nr:cytidylate kinase family protein [Pseudomonadota bacterium]